MFPKEAFNIKNLFLYSVEVILIHFSCIGSMSILIQYHIYADYYSALLSSIKVLPISFGLVFGCLCFSEKIVKFTTIKDFIILSAMVLLGCSICIL